jgi:hypothetical protein
MTTLILERESTPAPNDYYLSGYVDGQRAASNSAEHWHRVAEALWWGALEAMLLIEPTHPARRALSTTLERLQKQ